MMAFARKLKQQIKHDVKELLILVNGKKTIFFSSLEIRMNDHIFILMKNIFGMLSLHCKVIWKVPRRFNLKFTNFQHKLEYLSQARRGFSGQLFSQRESNIILLSMLFFLWQKMQRDTFRVKSKLAQLNNFDEKLLQ